MVPESSRDYTEDASHENGNYECQCVYCLHPFVGHKRRVVCKTCATDPLLQEAAAEDDQLFTDILLQNGNLDLTTASKQYTAQVEKKVKLRISDTQLLLAALAVAKELSFDNQLESDARHVIFEMSHRLGRRIVTIHRKRDGLLMIDCSGGARFLTRWEALLWRLFRLLPGGRVLAEQLPTSISEASTDGTAAVAS